MSDLNDPTINVNLWNDDKTKSVTVTTDGAKERLDVTTNIEDDQKTTPNPYPGINHSAFVENGGSPDMNVDGSVTPVVFTASPPTGKIWYIHTIDIVLEDAAMNFSKFGGLTALTNGVDFKLKENGAAEVTLANVKRNGDFYVFANDAFIESSSTDLLVAHVRIYINQGTTLKLVDGNSDYFSVTINDNLTTIDVFNTLVRGYEVDE